MSVSAFVPARRLAAVALVAAAVVGAVALASAADHGPRSYRKRVPISEPRYSFWDREDGRLDGRVPLHLHIGIGGDRFMDLFEDRCRYAWKQRLRHRHSAQRHRPPHRRGFPGRRTPLRHPARR